MQVYIHILFTFSLFIVSYVLIIHNSTRHVRMGRSRPHFSQEVIRYGTVDALSLGEDLIGHCAMNHMDGKGRTGDDCFTIACLAGVYCPGCSSLKKARCLDSQNC